MTNAYVKLNSTFICQ